MASRRSRMFFSPEMDSKDELFRVMLDWAFEGFKPSGPDGLRPQSEYNGMQQISTERHSLTLYFSARNVVLNFKFVVYLLFFFFPSLEQAFMPRLVNGNVGSSPNYKDQREKLLNLTVSLNKLPESLDLHKGSVNLEKTHVYRKFMHPKWNRRSSQTVRTCREQKDTHMNNRLTHCESVQVESRQNSQKRCMCTIYIY